MWKKYGGYARYDAEYTRYGCNTGTTTATTTFHCFHGGPCGGEGKENVAPKDNGEEHVGNGGLAILDSSIRPLPKHGENPHDEDGEEKEEEDIANEDPGALVRTS